MRKEIISKTIVTILSTAVIAAFWWLWSCLQPLFVRNLPPIITNVLSRCSQFAGSLATWLTAPVPVPTWLCLLVVGATLTALIPYVFAWFTKWRQRGPARVTPIFCAFTEFRRFGVVWRWEWKGRRIACVSAFCPQCDRRIRYDEGTASTSARPTILFCTNCDSVHVERPGKYPQIISDVTLEIEHAVRTGEWRRHLREAAESLPAHAATMKRRAA